MKEPILNDEQIDEIYERVHAEWEARNKCAPNLWVAFAAALESAILEKLCGEPYLYVYEYDRIGYVHRQLHASMWNGARESRCVALYTLKDPNHEDHR